MNLNHRVVSFFNFINIDNYKIKYLSSSNCRLCLEDANILTMSNNDKRVLQDFLSSVVLPNNKRLSVGFCGIMDAFLFGKPYDVTARGPTDEEVCGPASGKILCALQMETVCSQRFWPLLREYKEGKTSWVIAELLGAGALLAPVTRTAIRRFPLEEQRLLLANPCIVQKIRDHMAVHAVASPFSAFDSSMRTLLNSMQGESADHRFGEAIVQIRQGLQEIETQMSPLSLADSV